MYAVNAFVVGERALLVVGVPEFGGGLLTLARTCAQAL